MLATVRRLLHTRTLACLPADFAPAASSRQTARKGFLPRPASAKVVYAEKARDARDEIRRLCYDKHYPAALVAFARHLRSEHCSSSRLLERCIMRFGAGVTTAMENSRTGPRYMLDAFIRYVGAGFHPSLEIWTSLLQRTPVTPEELEHLMKLVAGSKSGPGIPADEEFVGTVMRLYAKGGRPDLVEEMFERYRGLLAARNDASLPKEPGPLLWKALIDGRGMLGDVHGAKQWFDVWRTSLAHPYGHLEQHHGHQGRTVRPPSRMIRMPTASNPFGVSASRSGQLKFRPAAHLRSAHTIIELPTPDPAPYLALFRYIVDHPDMAISNSTYDFIKIMAADRIPLTTPVMNALIHHETVKSEPNRLDAVMTLYMRMRRSRGTEKEMRPDATTFTRLFEAFREPKLDVSRPRNQAKPLSHLARITEMALPFPELVRNPRKVFWDMLDAFGGEGDLTTALLNGALGAFIRSRDFAGASVALEFFSRTRTEPNAETHGTVIMGLLRAKSRSEAFTSPSGASWLTVQTVAEAMERLDQLNRLTGYPPYDTPAEVTVFDPLADRPGDYIITRRPANADPAATWQDRPIPRTESQLRDTRRYELRDLDLLQLMLWKASYYASEEDYRLWRRERDIARKQMSRW